ncbi:hypothetical protein TthHB5018_b22760 (plasmid) [Thermus thermophilus]|uniref:Uncharacterized protein n=1 Tax=Thermus thermophilus TaxID=274 RepID=A0A7R7YJD8_THETH|nr:hypothetical protein TthHB5018_b22760 [Thermus thermophilus]
MKSEGHHQGPSLEGKGGHQGLVSAVLREGPVHDEGEGAVFGETRGEEGEEGFGEGPGVLQGGVMEEAPEAIEAALGQGGEGGSAGEVGEGGVQGSGEEGGQEEGEVGADGFPEGGEDLMDPEGDNLGKGVVGGTPYLPPLFSSLVKPQPSK